MKRDPLVYIDDILESIERIDGYVRGMSFEEFRNDRKTFDAVVRNIEVIGEAVKRIPESVTAKYPHIA